MNTRFFMLLLESRHFACSPSLCGDIFHGHALPCFGDIMACQRHCRDVDVPHKAVVNCDALCSTFSDPCVSYTSIWPISSRSSGAVSSSICINFRMAAINLSLLAACRSASAICSRSCGIFAFKASCSTSYSWVICRKPSSERSPSAFFSKAFL